MTAIHVVVRGRVQGVGFRYAAARRAGRLGVVGWVRNRRDGTVEVRAQGAPDAVAAFEGFLRSGPPAAQVTGVMVEPVEVDPSLRRFAILPTL